MSAADEAREVEVVREDVFDRHLWGGDYDCSCGHELISPQEFNRHLLAELEPVLATERQEAAREAVAALELTEETDVDWCDYEGWWDPYRDGAGSWEKCKLPADHEDEHRGVDGGSWPRDLQDPNDQPKPRRRRLIGPWQEVPRADGVAGRRET